MGGVDGDPVTISSQGQWQRAVRRKLFTSPHFEVRQAEHSADLEFAVVGHRKLTWYFYRDTESTIRQNRSGSDSCQTDDVLKGSKLECQGNQQDRDSPAHEKKVSTISSCRSSQTQLTSKNSFSSLDTKQLGMD